MPLEDRLPHSHFPVGDPTAGYQPKPEQKGQWEGLHCISDVCLSIVIDEANKPLGNWIGKRGKEGVLKLKAK